LKSFIAALGLLFLETKDEYIDHYEREELLLRNATAQIEERDYFF